MISLPTVFICMILINFVVGKDIGIIARKYPLTFSPAGFTFAIWSVIYISLSGLIVNGMIQTPPLFILSCIINSAWIFSWTKEYILISQFLLYGLTGVLFAMWYRGNDTIHQNVIAMYLTWTIGASILNTSICLRKYYTIDNKLLSISALTLFSGVHVGWHLLVKTTTLNKCVTVPLVGIWTSIGIILNRKEHSAYWVFGLAATVLGLLLNRQANLIKLFNTHKNIS